MLMKIFSFLPSAISLFSNNSYDESRMLTAPDLLITASLSYCLLLTVK